MKNFYILILSFFVIGLVDLQAQQSVNASGNNAVGSGGTASYSIGQVTYTSIGNAGASVNQGVQRVDITNVVQTKIKNNDNIRLIYSVYPNPTGENLNLRVDNLNTEKLSYELCDILGRTILAGKIVEKETSISMSNIPSAIYFLKIIDNSGDVKKSQAVKVTKL
jgi:hypothetical protein